MAAENVALSGPTSVGPHGFNEAAAHGRGKPDRKKNRIHSRDALQ